MTDNISARDRLAQITASPSVSRTISVRLCNVITAALDGEG